MERLLSNRVRSAELAEVAADCQVVASCRKVAAEGYSRRITSVAAFSASVSDERVCRRYNVALSFFALAQNWGSILPAYSGPPHSGLPLKSKRGEKRALGHQNLNAARSRKP